VHVAAVHLGQHPEPAVVQRPAVGGDAPQVLDGRRRDQRDRVHVGRPRSLHEVPVDVPPVEVSAHRLAEVGGPPLDGRTVGEAEAQVRAVGIELCGEPHERAVLLPL
jgi:hypothetical protein